MKNIINFCHKIVLPSVAYYVRRSGHNGIGCWRLITYWLPWLRKNGATLGSKRIYSVYSFVFYTDLGDWLGQYVYLTGDYEPSTSRVIFELLQPGETFIDIGANVGFFSLLGSKRVGAKGKVIAIEPIPSVHDSLKKNIKLNSATNIEIYDCALSNAEREVSIYEGPEGHKGTSSLRLISNASQKLKTRTRTLDSLLDEIPKVSLIKIDVEGAETLVLEGAKNLIARDKPNFVIEITDRFLEKMNSNAEQLCSLLKENGYSMYSIEFDGLVPIDILPDIWPDQFNALFSISTEIGNRLGVIPPPPN